MNRASWAACAGEAHRNAHVDDCRSCAPFWGRIPCCPNCGIRLLVAKDQRSGRCVAGRACHGMSYPILELTGA